MKSNQSFPRAEHLKSYKLIGQLFKEGQSFSVYPLRVVWLPRIGATERESAVQFTMTVPRRAFSKAVDRNRLRRQIREAYRINKSEFLETLPADAKLAIMVIFQAKEKMTYQEIEKSMIKLLQKLVRKIEA